MPVDGFLQSLERGRLIKITVTGRRTGRRFTRPVWYVLEGRTLWLLPVNGSETQWYRNVRVNPAIVIQSGKLRRNLRARAFTNASTVRKVIRLFGEKYTAKNIKLLYGRRLDVVVKVPLRKT